ncbi:MAG: dUTP diphosphatase [Firmicutes bacterium]|nr:dUTP diphosphatase [Bacillota bacterium]
MKTKMRGFEVVKEYLDKEIHLPMRNTTHAAGYDFESAETLTIPAHGIVAVSTGIKSYMQDNEVLQIYPRSSLAVKRHLMLVNSVGIIDKDYYNNPSNEGHIQILLRNFGDEDTIIQKGERIAQGIFMTFLLCDNEKKNGPTRLGGFGSTGL